MYKINHSKALLDLDALNLKWSIHHNLIEINANGHAGKINSVIP